MRLRSGGLDLFYIDESHDKSLYAVSALAVPFIRKIDAGWPLTGDEWHIVWPDYFAGLKRWRKRIAEAHKIPATKELHGTKILGERGNYIGGKRQLKREHAVPVVRDILSTIDFLPEASLITVVGKRGRQMYGHERLERVMHALFQRMRTQTDKRTANAMVFFDQGHPEYRALYRRAQINLPTGSLFGGQRNLPLDMFVEDGNEKNSKFCLFTQIVDLSAYAALAKVRHEQGELDEKQEKLGFHTLFDAIPLELKNTKAGRKDGIVWIG